VLKIFKIKFLENLKFNKFIYIIKNKRKEIYIKDAQGNVLAVYEVKVGAVADSLFTKEFNIFSTERIFCL
jgi:hypothetical protein